MHLAMHLVVPILSCCLLNFVAGQTEGRQDLDAVIDSIFKKPNVESKGPEVNPIDNVPGAGTCECVPYYLCKNGTIIEDGLGIIDIRIDNGPCGESLSVCCYAKDRSPEPVITPRPDTEKRKGCGRRNPKGAGFRITGAKDGEAQFGEFPWMAALLHEESIDGKKLLKYQCGASLIHPQVVLTAAHCIPDKNKQYKVRAGEWDTQTKNELHPHQDRDVKTILVHPDYKGGSLFYDFALLILDSPVEIAENVDVVCLPDQHEIIDNLMCYASGWGKDVFGKEGKYQVILKKIDLPIVDRDTCLARLRKTRLGVHFKLNESFLCAGGQPDKDTCKGDGGSPLVCPLRGKENKYFQAGIVAWGIGCGEDLTPGVYANVAKAITWIDNMMVGNGFDTSLYRN